MTVFTVQLYMHLFFLVRRQHVFVNTRRQFALYHRYVWCPETSIDLTALCVLESRSLSLEWQMQKGPFTGIIGSTGSLFRMYCNIFRFLFSGVFQGCSAKSACTPAYARVAIGHGVTARDLATLLALPSVHSSFLFSIRRPSRGWSRRGTGVRSSYKLARQISSFMYKRLTTIIGYTCTRARHARPGMPIS